MARGGEAAGPKEADRVAAAARRAASSRVSPEQRAAWGVAACRAGCTDRQRAIARSLARVARFEEVQRGTVPAGLRVMRLRAYSPFLSCGLLPGDLVSVAGSKKVETLADLPRVIRACAVGQSLWVERGGARKLLSRTSASGSQDVATKKRPAPPGGEDLPAGTRDLQ